MDEKIDELIYEGVLSYEDLFKLGTIAEGGFFGGVWYIAVILPSAYLITDSGWQVKRVLVGICVAVMLGALLAGFGAFNPLGRQRPVPYQEPNCRWHAYKIPLCMSVANVLGALVAGFSFVVTRPTVDYQRIDILLSMCVGAVVGGPVGAVLGAFIPA
jgi:hypothetical protein